MKASWSGPARPRTPTGLWRRRSTSGRAEKFHLPPSDRSTTSRLAKRFEARQEIAQQKTALEWEHRRGQAAGADGEGAGDGDDQIHVARGGQAAQLVGEVFGRPVTDDLQRDLGAVLVAEDEIGDQQAAAAEREHRALADEPPARALATELLGDGRLQARIELGRRRRAGAEVVGAGERERQRTPALAQLDPGL